MTRPPGGPGGSGSDGWDGPGGHHGDIDCDVAALPAPVPGGGYALRGVVVADSPDDLRGPVRRKVRLPLHVDASVRPVYDLDEDYFRQLVYRLVLLEAATAEDLKAWLNGDTLCGTGRCCTCRASCGAAWEARHPMLRERSAGPHVPRP